MAKKRPVDRQPKKAQSDKAYSSKRYTEKTLREDRTYGFYWYAWLWAAVRRILIVLCALVIAIGIVTTGWQKLYETFLMPPEPGSVEMVEFDIASGSSVSAIAKKLQNSGLVRNAAIFRYYVQFTNSATDLKYGTYYLSPGMEITEIVSALTSNVTTEERTITIIPGWTCEKIAEHLVSIGAIKNTDEFLKLCNEPERFLGYCYTLRDDYENGRLTGRKYALEGYLAPDTYRVFTTATAEEIIQKLVSQSNTVLDSVYYSNAGAEDGIDQLSYATGTVAATDESGNTVVTETAMTAEDGTFISTLSMDETVILASMIEREAGTTSDFTKISAVFHNRLLKGWKLESDATISYALGLNKLNLSEDEMTTASGYNTYLNPGLPTGPLCSPSKAAIEAALHPDSGYMKDGFMYFCAGDPETNESVFARTEADHNYNVSLYRNLWIAYDEKQSQKDSATGASGDNAAAP